MQLQDELHRLNALQIRISFDPTGNDPGAAVYFRRKKEQMVMAVDRFKTTAANLRSITLAISAMRTLERHGGAPMADRAFAGFVALPAPQSCWEVLGIKPGANPHEIERAYRAHAVQRHPDRGGSNAAMAELNDARDKALNGKSS
jgi:DnaJ domain